MRSHPTRILLLRRSHVAWLAALALSAAIFYVVARPAAVAAGTTARQLPIYSVECSQPLCSISFDAAWGNEDTQKLMDQYARLDEYGRHTIKTVMQVEYDRCTELSSADADSYDMPSVNVSADKAR